MSVKSNFGDIHLGGSSTTSIIPSDYFGVGFKQDIQL